MGVVLIVEDVMRIEETADYWKKESLRLDLIRSRSIL